MNMGKKLSVLFILFFQFSLSKIKICELNDISTDLLNSQDSYEYIIYNETKENITITLKKQISKTRVKNIVSKNYLYLKNISENNIVNYEVPFENIDSFYLNILYSDILICPKGKFHPYNLINNISIVPPSFEDRGDWDLKCYLHDTEFFLIFYLMNTFKNFYFSYSNGEIKECKNYFYDKLYDFKLENGNYYENYEYKFPVISYDNGYIALRGKILVFVKLENKVNINTIHGEKTITLVKESTQASFDDNNYFYYFSYNDISDFISGYSTTNFDIYGNYNIDSVSIYNYTESPFICLHKFKNNYIIKEMRFIPNTSYAYYIIYNKKIGLYYYGIIDIKINKILYNIQGYFTKYIPYSSNEMLASNSTSVYKINIKINDNLYNNICENEVDDEPCYSDQYLLMPENYCIDKIDCDLNIYLLNKNNTICALCSYYYPNDKIYRLLNGSNCISYIPNNTEFYNANLKVLKCLTNYHLNNNNNECIPDFCYESCKSCYQISYNIEDQKCITCANGYYLNTYNNCLKKNTSIICKNGYYISDDDSCVLCNSLCNIYENNSCNCLSCPENYELKFMKCIGNEESKTNIFNYEEIQLINESSIEYYYYGYYEGINEQILILKTTNKTNVENEILNILRNKLNNSEINFLYLTMGYFFYVKSGNTKFIISKLDENNEEIIPSINLGTCEDKLRGEKNISKNNFLYILNIIKNEEGILIPKTVFEIYYYNNENNKFDNLNLEVCKDIFINKTISINISESEIDKYNSSSGYYNDICYTHTTEKNTDITLIDRREEYIKESLLACEDDCKFIAYNFTKKKAICSCPILVQLSRISDLKFDKQKLTDNFINFNNLANMQALKCYNILFNKNFINNAGSLIISGIILIDIVSMIIFYSYGYNLLNKSIQFIYNIKRLKIKNNNICSKNKTKKITPKKNKKLKLKTNGDRTKTIKIKNKKNKTDPSAKNIRITDINNQAPPKRIIRDKKESKKITNIKININNKITNNLSGQNNISKIINKNMSNKISTSSEYLNMNNLKNLNDIQKEEIYKNTIKYSDLELNNFTYEKAIKLDNRTFCQYYISLIRTKHLLIFTFCNNKDNNSRIIKIILLFFTFAVNFSVNALFFSDSTMHQIYKDEGKYNLEYQIPQIIYCSLISSVIVSVSKMLALSEKNILRIKNAENPNLFKIYKSETNIIKYKFIFFFVLIFILLLLFWYYIGCFCAIYRNTQIHLISDTLISFATELIYPFALYLLPVIFRFISLKNKKSSKKCCYNISRIIQYLV